MNYEKYLPIGTVVLLKEGSKKIMIIGFCAMAKKDDKTIYDYSGCLYPEGLLTSDQTLLFNHNQIEKIYHIGFHDDDDKKFKENLKVLMTKINNNEANK